MLNPGIALALALILIACGGPTRVGEPTAGKENVPAGPKRLVVALTNEPVAFYPALTPTPVAAAAGALQNLVLPGMSLADPEGVLRPILGEAVPTVENGLWKLFPDGTMETSHTIRSGAAWHDGTPFTSEDLIFTFQVLRDRDLPVFRSRNLDFVQGVEPVDARTVRVRWSQLFIEADTMFGTLARPIPRHLLQEAYGGAKAGIPELRYWSDDFVGLGPFQLKEWARGSHLKLASFESYVLGRPKLDEISVSFIGDANTLVANLLAGSVDLPLGAPVSIDQAITLKDQWQGGNVTTFPAGMLYAYVQMLDPTPAIVLNQQFRQAMLYALERQTLADNLMGGLSSVAHSILSPDTPEYAATAASIVRYAYDPRRALDLFDGLGYRLGSDGLLHDSGGAKLSIEVRAYANRDIQVKTMLPVVSYWQQVGVAVDPVVRPNQAATDLQDLATFPGITVLRTGNGLSRLVAHHSNQARVAATNYNGSNNGRYINPEMDNLIDRYNMTIPMAERMAVAAQIIRLQTEQLPFLSLFYEAQASLMSSRVTNVAAEAQTWNGHEWDVR